MRDPAFEAARPRLEEAARLHQGGQRARAIDLYRQLIAELPRLPPLANLLGLALVQEGQVGEGLRHLSRAVELAPNFPDAWLNLAFARYEAGDRDGAIAAYRRLLQLEPNHLSALLSLASLLGEMDSAETVALLRRATEVAPGRALPWLRLRRVYQVLGDVAGMAEAQRKLSQLPLRTAEELTEAGHLDLMQQRLPEGIELFREALKLQPAHANAAFGLGEALLRNRAYEEALRHLRHAVALAPRRSSPWLAIGRVHLALGQREEAAAAFQEALQRGHDQVAHHLLEIARGEAAAAAPAEYVQWLYDQRAIAYDSRPERSDYALPARIGDLLAQLVPGKARNALELGCGTGAVALPIRRHAARLAGLDLSRAMLHFATLGGRYDDLIAQEAVSYLQGTQERYDLIVAADMLIHIGDLRPLFGEVAAHLEPGGLFIVTTERLEGESGEAGFVLQLKGTFAHGDDYLRAVAESSGLLAVHWAEVGLPREEGRPVAGTLAAFRTPAGEV